MPLYVYECLQCGAMFEKLRSWDDVDEPVLCSNCHAECKRKYSPPAINFEGRWIPTREGPKRNV